MNMASRKPWYYVPGRKDLTEKLISRKREREAHREQVWSDTNKYFNRCNAQTLLHKQWEKQKPKVNYEDVVDNLPPFDVVESLFRRKKLPVDIVGEEKLEEVAVQVKLLTEKIRSKNDSAVELEELGELILARIQIVRELKADLETQVQSWQLKKNKLAYIRFARDKLRHQAFLILEQLHHYKVLVECLTQEDEDHQVLNEDECGQLESIVQGALNIIQIYIELNEKRNGEFVRLFHEEAQLSYPQYDAQWTAEEPIWSGLVIRILDMVQGIYAEKLQGNISHQERMLEERERTLLELTQLIKDIKKEPVLCQALAGRNLLEQ